MPGRSSAALDWDTDSQDQRTGEVGGWKWEGQCEEEQVCRCPLPELI